MSVVQPDLEPLAGENLFDDQIRYSVLVHVEGRKGQAAFRRRECDRVTVVAGYVKLNAKSPLSVQQSGFYKNRSVRLLIIIEVSSRNLGRKLCHCMGCLCDAR